MPRFVILRHEPPPGSRGTPHWDLMLESGDALRTWALAELPATGRSNAGTFQWERDTACEVVVRLNGKRVSGQATLTRIDETSNCWQFVLRPTW